MSVYASSDELRDVLVEMIDGFLASDAGAAAAARAGLLDVPPVLEVHVHGPELVLHVDVGARTVADGAAGGAGAVLELQADDLHELLLDRLGPVEISRLVEEERLHLRGTPPALVGALVLAGELQAGYPAVLERRGRDDLLATPLPVVGEIWESDHPPAPVFGKRRPWQRPKGTAAG